MMPPYVDARLVQAVDDFRKDLIVGNVKTPLTAR
jgi:hypothetical protein